MIGTIIGAAAQIGSSIYGAAKSAQMNNRARQLLRQEKAEVNQWYEQKLNEDYLSRSDVQAALTAQREILDEKYKQARATQAVAGGTDEAVALQKEAANKSLGETTRSIAAQASAYKDNLAQQQLAAMQNYGAQERAILTGQGEAVANAASQAGSVLGQAGVAADEWLSGKTGIRKKEA